MFLFNRSFCMFHIHILMFRYIEPFRSRNFIVIMEKCMIGIGNLDDLIIYLYQ